MARPRNPIPVYKKHPTKSEARCYVGGKWISLGTYGSEESRREYERVCAKVREADARNVPRQAVHPKQKATVADITAAFLAFARGHYRRASDGKATTELREYVAALGHALDLYAETPAAEFGPLALQAVRQQMIDVSGWCRNRVNKQVGRIRRAFKWATAQEMVPAGVLQALACVGGLQKGRTTAKETEKVGPVPRAWVAATLPRLSRHVGAMVELQLVTGMRPGEVAGMTLGQVDRSGGDGEPWIYRPTQHKGTHRERDRVIPLGPKAKDVLRRFFVGLAGGEPGLGANDPIFSPKVAREEGYARMRAARKTKVQPSQQAGKRRKANPKRKPGAWYSDTTYAHAVERAAEKAGVGHWHPNQLRHTFASEVRKRFGLEAAQVLLGHAKANTTEIYAERDLALATKVANEMG